jgi:hypothetical protein
MIKTLILAGVGLSDGIAGFAPAHARLPRDCASMEVLQRMAALARPKARPGGRIAPGQMETARVIGVTEWSALGQIGSRESRLMAGEWINDGKR